MPYKIGLTGGIGSGKSTVSRAFAELGVPTFDADQVGHELSAKAQPGYLKIVELFGERVLSSKAELDRQALGDIVFKDPRLRTRLEQILHPMILQRMHQQADAAPYPYCVLDIPLLVNTPEVTQVDRVLVVHCDRSLRRERIRSRNGWSENKISRVMDSQPDEEILLAAANDIIDNSGSLAEVERQVKKLHANYLAVAKIQQQ